MPQKRPDTVGEVGRRDGAELVHQAQSGLPLRKAALATRAVPSGTGRIGSGLATWRASAADRQPIPRHRPPPAQPDFASSIHTLWRKSHHVHAEHPYERCSVILPFSGAFKVPAKSLTAPASADAAGARSTCGARCGGQARLRILATAGPGSPPAGAGTCRQIVICGEPIAMWEKGRRPRPSKEGRRHEGGAATRAIRFPSAAPLRSKPRQLKEGCGERSKWACNAPGWWSREYTGGCWSVAKRLRRTANKVPATAAALSAAARPLSAAPATLAASARAAKLPDPAAGGRIQHECDRRAGAGRVSPT